MTTTNPPTSTHGSESCNTMDVKKQDCLRDAGDCREVRPLDWQDRVVLRGVAVVLMLFVLMVVEGLIQ